MLNPENVEGIDLAVKPGLRRGMHPYWAKTSSACDRSAHAWLVAQSSQLMMCCSTTACADRSRSNATPARYVRLTINPVPRAGRQECGEPGDGVPETSA
jgi:hypothetical protein